MRLPKLFRTLLLVLLASAGAARADPALWVAHSPTATVYLFGTVHTLKAGHPWRSKRLGIALASSDDLWLEMTGGDDQAAMTALVQQYGIDVAHPLSAKLSDVERKRLETVAAWPGLPGIGGMNLMRPWMAAVLIGEVQMTKAGYQADQGVEAVLTADMKASGKPIHGFETAEQQLRYFVDLPPNVEIEMLDEALDDADAGTGKIDAIVDAWLKGDVATIGKLIAEDASLHQPAAYKALIVNRNIAWAARIRDLLHTNGTIFVAVGAGHLAGPDSVQVQLARLGVKTEREQ